MKCPSCDFPVGRGTSCPRCGARLPGTPSPAASGTGNTLKALAAVLALAVVGAAAALVALRGKQPTAASTQAAASSPPATVRAPPPQAAAALEADPEKQPQPGFVPAQTTAQRRAISPEDAQAARAIVARVNARQPLGPDDLPTAEALHARYPQESQVENLLQGVLIVTAQEDQAGRRFQEASARLERAATIGTDRRTPLIALAAVHLDAGTWPDAETAARAALKLDEADAEALWILGFALYRQDRNREAAYALEASLDIEERPDARAILDRLRKGQSDERGMGQRRISHFNVRYDGGEHESVGREILRALERHYATLARTFDHKPEVPIPVILFTREAYYDASGAPAWSGGVYDSIDGRIRIPIGGLDARLNPDMDGTLIHEVTHAFIADITRGVCPRDVHEGVAQYMEGKRIRKLLDASQIEALAQGRVPGVQGFYLGALSFVEYLIGARGQGGINDLLEAMGETGSVDEAFRRVHGRDHSSIKQLWATRLRQRHG